MSGQCLSPSEPGHALTPGTHLWLGAPLPHQQPNRTQTAPPAINLWSGDFIGYYTKFPWAIPDQRVHRNALLALSPLHALPKKLSSFDLHVLAMPPAFNLSQDQTLQLNDCRRPKATESSEEEICLGIRPGRNPAVMVYIEFSTRCQGVG